MSLEGSYRWRIWYGIRYNQMDKIENSIHNEIINQVQDEIINQVQDRIRDRITRFDHHLIWGQMLENHRGI